MDIITGVEIFLTIIGGATVLFRLLMPLAEATEYKWDDTILKKALLVTTKITELVSLNKSNSKLEIKLNK